MFDDSLGPLILQEASLLNDIQLLAKRAECGERVWARDVSALLDRYGVSFDELPSNLQRAIDKIELAD